MRRVSLLVVAAKPSLSGEREAFPWLCSSSKSGVSRTWVRIASATSAMSEPAKKGTRQPQLSMDSLDRDAASTATRPEARNTPSPAITLARLVVNPRRPDRADSKSMTKVPVNSPPSETPEIIRANKNTAGAKNPTIA
jgi:hypothetical protein